MKNRDFIPERQPIDLDQERSPAVLALDCAKEYNHSQYSSLHELTVDHLPEKWRNETVLQDLKAIGRRVVHLTVLKSSPRRPGRGDGFPCMGSGFITFHPVHGALIHTSKHVVYDPYEAKFTLVRLFYEDDENALRVLPAIQKLQARVLENPRKSEEISVPAQFLNQCVRSTGLFVCRGSTHYFQSVMCSDYTTFSCEMPVHELFSDEEIKRLEAAFSWWKFSLKHIVLSPQLDIDVAVISHPHGTPKSVSFGKMSRLARVAPALYDAPTCKGSSGSPVIRLHQSSSHYISAGQFVHHGHNKGILDMGMGTVRLPIAFPYWQPLDTEDSLRNMINILYEPVTYWTLVLCDLLHIESTLYNSRDVFAYTSSLSALCLSVESVLFKTLFTLYWLHILGTTVFRAVKVGPWYALCLAISTFISMFMFYAAWIMMHVLPWTLTNMLFTIIVWLLVLYFERYFNLSWRATGRTLGPFPELIRYRMAVEYGQKARNTKCPDLATTQNT